MPNSKGNVLLEIAIVGVLIAGIVFGIVHYALEMNSSIQDSKRMQDIERLSKSIELAKDATSPIFNYSQAKFSEDFPDKSQIPADPNNKAHYCVWQTTDDARPVFPDTESWGELCPIGWQPLTSKTALVTEIKDAKSWAICAKLERMYGVFCLPNIF